MAEFQLDDDLRKKVRDEYVERRRALVATILERGIKRGELPADTNIQIATDLIVGFNTYRFLFDNPGAKAEAKQALLKETRMAVRLIVDGLQSKSLGHKTPKRIKRALAA